MCKGPKEAGANAALEVGCCERPGEEMILGCRTGMVMSLGWC